MSRFWKLSCTQHFHEFDVPKEFFQAFAWYIRYFCDELIFIIVVIMRKPCDRYLCNSIGRINMARPKPIITISLHVICVKFPLLFVRVWMYLISLSIILVGLCPQNKFLLHLDCSCGIILDNKYLWHNKIWLCIKLLGIIKFSPNMSLNWTSTTISSVLNRLFHVVVSPRYFVL